MYALRVKMSKQLNFIKKSTNIYELNCLHLRLTKSSSSFVYDRTLSAIENNLSRRRKVATMLNFNLPNFAIMGYIFSLCPHHNSESLFLVV